MKIKNAKLRTVLYAGDHGDCSNLRNVVAYMIYPDRQIVFTGLHNGETGARGSTINFAEEIVYAISQHAGIDPRRFTFFDLQTRTSYSDADYKPGNYRFSQLCLEWKNPSEDPFSHHCMNWLGGHPADQVVADFAEFIWGNLPPDTLRNMDVAYGAIEPLPAQKAVSG